MTAESGQGWFEADALRRLVPIVALAVALVAVLTQPSTLPDLVLVCLPVVAFTIWAFVPATPLLALSIAVIVPVVIAQRSGELEPLMFEASILAFVVGRWSPSLKSAVPLGVLAAASPALVALVQEPAEVAVAIWTMGIAFPWVLSRAFVRQERLADQLADTRRELAERAMVAERREIARDVHDFVGHGLAAVMLQVTSARHVLRRDPEAAEGGASVGRGGRAPQHAGAPSYGDAAAQRRDRRGPAGSIRRRDPRASSIRRGREVSPSSCRRGETCPRSPPVSGSRSIASAKRRWRMRLATPHVRGRHSG